MSPSPWKRKDIKNLLQILILQHTNKAVSVQRGYYLSETKCFQGQGQAALQQAIFIQLRKKLDKNVTGQFAPVPATHPNPRNRNI